MIYPFYPLSLFPYWLDVLSPISYYNPLSPWLFDSYLLGSPLRLPSLLATPYAIPSLWRYSPDLNLLGFNLQESATQAEFWTNLHRSLSDSYGRILRTASAPENV